MPESPDFDQIARDLVDAYDPEAMADRSIALDIVEQLRQVWNARGAADLAEAGRRVWVVEQGEYSDYRVVGVFSSNENAQQMADAINAPGEYKSIEHATVAEWPLDPAVHELRQGFMPFLVDMREDGTVERCERWDVSGYELAGYVRMWRRTLAPAFRGNPDKPDILQTLIWAKDAEHAVKITNEHRTRMIASDEWATDIPAQRD